MNPVAPDEYQYRLSTPLGEIMQARALDIDEKRKEPDKWKPIPTHIPALNAIIGGFPVEQPFYMLIFADEKLGKTTIAMDLADAWRKGSGEPVMYAQLEELGVQYADRTIASMTSLTRSDLRMFNINDEQMQEIYVAAQKRTQNDNLYIQDDLFSLYTLVQEMKRLKCKKGVIDNFQLAEQEGHKGSNSQERFAAMSRYLMKLRNQEGYSWVAINQKGQKGVFGSSQPEKDADIRIEIAYSYETGEDDEEHQVEGLRELIVHPGRIGGVGKCQVTFNGDKNQIGPVRKIDINSQDFLDIVSKEGPPPMFII